MTPPIDTFRTHDRRSLDARMFREFLETHLKLAGQHVIGVVAKTFVLPAFVGRFSIEDTSCTASAKRFEPPIVNVVLCQ